MLIAPEVFWRSALGLALLLAGFFTYRRDLLKSSTGLSSKMFAFAPVLIAAPLAAFAGEHFTLARDISRLVRKWMPARLFITYCVGVALLSAALSLPARRCLRWSTPLLGIMFALFALLQDLPAPLAHPGNRVNWILTARKATFSMGAWALFSTHAR